jgi:hypothetical protein
LCYQYNALQAGGEVVGAVKQDRLSAAEKPTALQSRAAVVSGLGEGVQMEPTEIQARATIAAALILTRAVEIPTMPTSGDWSRDTAALRLRDLTDHVYQVITSPPPR